MSECVFCGIVEGRLPCHLVLEDEHTVAFLDIGAAALGHTLVVPRLHARDIWEISPEEYGRVSVMAHRVAAVVREAFKPEGVNITHSSGKAAWQEVFHFHTHVVPRWHGDGLRPPWSARNPSQDELAQIAERMRAALND